jgi:hypothetical protein
MWHAGTPGGKEWLFYVRDQHIHQWRAVQTMRRSRLREEAKAAD